MDSIERYRSIGLRAFCMPSGRDLTCYFVYPIGSNNFYNLDEIVYANSIMTVALLTRLLDCIYPKKDFYIRWGLQKDPERLARRDWEHMSSCTKGFQICRLCPSLHYDKVITSINHFNCTIYQVKSPNIILTLFRGPYINCDKLVFTI